MYGNKGGFRPSGGFRPRGSFAPVKVGEELEVSIEAVGEKGDGIAKKNGFVLFVPNTKEGDHVRVRVNKVLRKVGFAEVIGGKGSPAKSAPADGEEYAEESSEESSEEETPQDSEEFGDEESQTETSDEEEEPKKGSSDWEEDTEDFGDEEKSE
ncbi:TRAM domain-containing protein [Candidatus Woesearchaeota archaeon]|nr:TRAM domain-containing protein [Candidatus Woesearchaeota archaeon]